MRRAVSSPIVKASRLTAHAATALLLSAAPVEAQTVDYDTDDDGDIDGRPLEQLRGLAAPQFPQRKRRVRPQHSHWTVPLPFHAASRATGVGEQLGRAAWR